MLNSFVLIYDILPHCVLDLCPSDLGHVCDITNFYGEYLYHIVLNPSGQDMGYECRHIKTEGWVGIYTDWHNSTYPVNGKRWGLKMPCTKLEVLHADHNETKDTKSFFPSENFMR